MTLPMAKSCRTIKRFRDNGKCHNGEKKGRLARLRSAGRAHLRHGAVISRRDAPESLVNLPPKRGRGERRVPAAPAASCALCIGRIAHESTSTPESPDVPARNGFNGFLRALVSAKSARMCERAVLTNRPSLDLSPFVLEGRKSLPGSVGQVRCLPQPEQLHGLRARTEQGRELDDGTK
jgi:hypothetical protein